MDREGKRIIKKRDGVVLRELYSRYMIQEGRTSEVNATAYISQTAILSFLLARFNKPGSSPAEGSVAGPLMSTRCCSTSTLNSLKT